VRGAGPSTDADAVLAPTATMPPPSAPLPTLLVARLPTAALAHAPSSLALARRVSDDLAVLLEIARGRTLVLSAETDADWADVTFHLADGAAAAPGEPSAAALRATLVALQRDGDLNLAGAQCMSLELRVATDGAAPPPPPPAEASAAEQQLTTAASALAGLSAFLLFALAAAAATLASYNRTLNRLLAPVPPPFEAVCAD
jgi:hypothetical protein